MHYMKNYKEFEKDYNIGSSDYAALTMTGFRKNVGVISQILKFGQDDTYSAYIVYGKDVEIGKHYEKVAEFDSWLKIYDDNGLTTEYTAEKIIIYRAGEMGCIIQCIND